MTSSNSMVHATCSICLLIAHWRHSLTFRRIQVGRLVSIPKGCAMLWMISLIPWMAKQRYEETKLQLNVLQFESTD